MSCREAQPNQSLQQVKNLQFTSLQNSPNKRPAELRPPSAGDNNVKENYKTIRVENWGIFLLSRLTSYFQKKEYCDLILRFPDRNAQIKVHKLVVNACTEWFVQKEREGRIIEGVLDMPPELTPEAVAPIIRFMYSGLLDLKDGAFNTLRDTAHFLQMNVLTKLMDAQMNAHLNPITPNNKKKRKLSSDPVRQIKHIKRIEKKFEHNERKAKILAAKAKQDSDCLPGKKLPIWKKRTSLPPPPQPPKPEVKPDDDDATPRRMVEKSTPVTYSKKQSEQKNLPPKIREIEQTLLFEKVLRTGSKNNANNKENAEEEEETEIRKDMSVDEMKEFMAEQRKRLDLEDNDDYYNDHEELTYDDYEDNPDEPEPISILKPSETNQDDLPDVSQPRKSVRFSLKPGSIPTPKDIDCSEDDVAAEIDKLQKVRVFPKQKKRGRPPKIDDQVNDFVDTNVDEFSKELENESKPIAKKTIPPPPQKSINLNSNSKPEQSDSPKKFTADQEAVISQVLKQYPDLFKDKKQVKLKVKTLDSEGKHMMQTITLRANDVPKKVDNTDNMAKRTITVGNSVISTAEQMSLGIRDVPKVKYTGKRGRPKKLQVGEADPHARERNKIDSRLKEIAKIQFSETMVVNDYVPEDDQAVSDVKSSSEAESLSNVASGIATSLGVEEFETNKGNNVQEAKIHEKDNTKNASDLAMDWEEEEEEEEDEKAK